MRKLLVLALPLLLLGSVTVFSQKKSDKYKFGDIKPEDFAPTVYSIDSNANAVVLADIGESKYEGSNDGFFNLLFDRSVRIRILKKAGFDEATVKIPLYFVGSKEERMDNLEAVTYNLENGKVVATKLDKASIFKDKYSKSRTVRKFTFPNIKEGSIIEYKYTIKSPFFWALQPWWFQGGIPRLWSDYQITVPTSVFDFVLLKHGNLNYVVDSQYTSHERYLILFPGDATESSQVGSLDATTVTARWAMKNVPAIKDESYVTTLDNYTARIQFQLRRITYSATDVVDYLGNWYKLAEQLMKDEDFGVPITDNNGWMKDDMKRITAGAKTEREKAQKVYEYIRDNFTCSSEEGLYTTKPLKKTFQDKNGTVGDLNLLLVAAMRNIGLQADAAILSTRDNGRVDEVYPIMEQYNYVVARVKADSINYVLDATNKAAGFAKLPAELYNGSARVVADVPALVPLSPDSLQDTKITSVFITNDDNSKGLSASFSTKFGDQESLSMRQKFNKEKPEDYFKDLKKNYSFETEISNPEIDSLKMPDMPLTIKYNFTFNTNDEDIIYFNPLLAEVTKENPFKSAVRQYPVEMAYCGQEVYVLNMEIPKGYRIEEIPKSARVNLNDDEGMFEYIIGVSGNRIQLRCRTKLNKANFQTDDYQSLRDFYGYVVKKEAEQIVFKKL
jgi:hypothetical protein